MAMNLGGDRVVVADMNVTPMIDILLVLIIVFMVIQTARNSTGLDAQIPRRSDNSDASPRTVVVQVVSAGLDHPRLLINQDPVEWEALRSRLVHIYKTRAERVLFIKADRDIDFQEVANVIDTAHGAFQDMRIGLITT